ncbi:hypothetical protein [Mycobacterium sp. 134]|uniref:hypothetical protein n=1 Tax=Mycobacterium sp. 134 TaxID=3400425 RepID=UPI003AAD479C
MDDHGRHDRLRLRQQVNMFGVDAAGPGREIAAKIVEGDLHDVVIRAAEGFEYPF